MLLRRRHRLVSSPPPPPSGGQYTVWLDSSDSSTITKDASNNVSSWLNKADINMSATAAGALRPTWTPDSGIRFDGTQYFEMGTVSDFIYLHDGTGCTIVVIASADNTLTGGTQGLVATRSAASNTGFGHYVVNSDGLNVSVSGGGSNVISDNVTGLVTSSQIFCSASCWKREAGTNTRTHFVDAIAPYVDSTNANAVSNADASFTMKIGANGNGTANMTGNIYEVLIIDTFCGNDCYIRSVMDYAAAKYGVEVTY